MFTWLVIRIRPSNEFRTKGAILHKSEDRYKLVSRQLMAWSQIWSVQPRLTLQTIPYDALTL